MAEEMDADVDFCSENADEYFGQDVQRLESAHLKSGYRDGITDGQESSLQKGFNDGFSQAALQYGTTSRFRGCISALLVYWSSKGGNSYLKDGMDKLESFLAQLKDLEAKEPEIDRENIARLNKRLEQLQRQKQLQQKLDSNDYFQNGDIDHATKMINSMDVDDKRLSTPATSTDGTSVQNSNDCCNDSPYSKHGNTEMINNSDNSICEDAFQNSDSTSQKLTVLFNSDTEWLQIEMVLRQFQFSEQLIGNLKATVLDVKPKN